MKPDKMEKILVFTDIHLCDNGREIIGLNPTEQFKRGLSHALQTHPDAKRVVITGDLAHSGTPEQYAQLKELLKDVHIPISLLIGNHDRREAFIDAFPETARDENGFVQSVVPFGDTVLITLDTLNGPPYSDASHIGLLCEKRRAWLKAQLEAAKDKRVLIFMHHPPFKVGFAGMDIIRLHEGESFLDMLAEYPNVAHLIAGHVHRTISGTSRGISFSMFKSTCHQMPMAINNFDPSISVDEPAAYGILFLTEHSILAHTEDFDIAQSCDEGCSDAMG